MYRTGFGYDSHRFAENRPLMLGGVRVEYSLGLAGHSDADVLLHAVTDAILGAAGLCDIGELFPDNDPANKNVSSDRFLLKALELAREKGYAVVNCDCTILAEVPKLGPVKLAICENLSSLMGVSTDDVSVKAKTNETMGAIGRKEGIAAMVSVLLKKSDK